MSGTDSTSSFTFPFYDDGSGILAASATLQLSSDGKTWSSFQFELDTGACIPTLPASAGKILGVNSKNGQALQLEGVDNKPITCYQYTLQGRFQGSTIAFPIDVVILPFEGSILLGRESLWGQQFSSIQIDCVKQQTTFTLLPKVVP